MAVILPCIRKAFKINGFSFPKQFGFFVYCEQDREEPETTDKNLGNVPFEAKFAQEEIVASNFSEDPGCDGFVMNSAPLFEVELI